MAARREQLMGTALKLFADHGFRGTTTRRIAEEAGVTEAVIFQHFADKDALYAAILEAKAGDAGRSSGSPSSRCSPPVAMPRPCCGACSRASSTCTSGTPTTCA